MAKTKDEAPAAAKVKKEPTSYLVLERIMGDGGLDGTERVEGWSPIGTAAAHTKSDAIKAVIKYDTPTASGEQYRAGVFRAVPERSWSDEPDLANENKQVVLPVFTEPNKKPAPATAERVPATA